MSDPSPFAPLAQRAFSVQEAVARLPGVPRGAALLYGRMARFTANGGLCFASVAYLARNLNASERSVERWLNALVQAGLIRRYHDHRLGLRTRVTEFLSHPCFGGVAPVEPGPGAVQLGLFSPPVDKPVEKEWNSCESPASDPPEVADHTRQKWRVPPNMSSESEGKKLSSDTRSSNGRLQDLPPAPAANPEKPPARERPPSEAGWGQPTTRGPSAPQRAPGDRDALIRNGLPISITDLAGRLRMDRRPKPLPSESRMGDFAPPGSETPHSKLDR